MSTLQLGTLLADVVLELAQLHLEGGMSFGTLLLELLGLLQATFRFVLLTGKSVEIALDFWGRLA